LKAKFEGERNYQNLICALRTSASSHTQRIRALQGIKIIVTLRLFLPAIAEVNNNGEKAAILALRIIL